MLQGDAGSWGGALPSQGPLSVNNTRASGASIDERRHAVLTRSEHRIGMHRAPFAGLGEYAQGHAQFDVSGVQECRRMRRATSGLNTKRLIEQKRGIGVASTLTDQE